MTDRPRMPDDSVFDSDTERRLRAAFAASAAPEAPEAVHAEMARLGASADVRVSRRLRSWPAPGWIAVVLGLAAILIGSLFVGGSTPAPTVPAVPFASAGNPSAAVTGGCGVSPGTMHGTWWREIGGPNAFFNWEAEPRRLERAAPWKLIVRFDPDARAGEVVSVSADNLDTHEQAVGALNSRMDPSNIYNFDSPAPDLPGGWYLFEQPLPSAGCWRLSAAIDGQVAGTAVVEVLDPAVPSTPADPSAGPTPEAEATPWPAVASMAPAEDDILPLAGRDGVPGMLRCESFGPPFTFEALSNPTGAELRVGPEFDALRAVTVGRPDRDGSLGPTFREVARDSQSVLFLYERGGFRVADGGRFIAIRVARDGTGWRMGNYGDCFLMAVPSPGYGRAHWTLDPAFKAPGPDTRTLHLLVREEACSGGRTASGRISSAFVTWDADELVIELFVQTLPGDHECPGVPATPATLRLPVPLGDRTLFDAGTIGQGGAGG
jgi:hypothetical protein